MSDFQYGANLILDLEQARQILLDWEICNPETLPKERVLDNLLVEITARISDWLRYDPVPQNREEVVHLNSQGKATLSHYPVVDVFSIVLMDEFKVDHPLSADWIKIIWQRGDRDLCFQGRSSWTMRARISYRSGYDPLEREFVLAASELLKEIVARNEDGRYSLKFLNEPVRDATSMSAGGASKSFRLGAGAEGKDPGTELDRLLSGYLYEKRRHVIC